ncbi:MAG: hypothetical protein RQ930_03560 [Candidatus Aenigmarchaeota archaeon]|jgi:hypothetical protein|nr:hypothetical protein [Candidatus Aenigmarchaeota archaeon]
MTGFIRYSWRSKNLYEIAKELEPLGIEIEMGKEIEIKSPNEIREIVTYLHVRGDNVSGILRPTSIYLDVLRMPTEKDRKLIEYAFRNYPRTISRENIGLAIFMLTSGIVWIVCMYLLLSK